MSSTSLKHDFWVCPADPGAILAVIVLYNKQFDDAPAARVIRRWIFNPSKNRSDLYLKHCLIYDNSPITEPLNLDDCGESIDFFHDVSNGGTRAAYLHALEMAKKKQCSWVLFLDHDTKLPENFLSITQVTLSNLAEDIHVGAIVPRVYEGGSLLSPSYITPYGRTFFRVWKDREGGGGNELTAIASASLVMRNSLERILPIPDVFFLDYLDHWVFRELQRRGKKIIISPAEIEHSLSVRSMNSISAKRYGAILAAELTFLRGGEKYFPFVYFLWLGMRSVRVLFSTRRFALARVCYAAMSNVLKKNEDI